MFDLVWSKLRRPWRGPGIVRRAALLEKLDLDRSGPIVSVQAPAGCGKSTLLASRRNVAARRSASGLGRRAAVTRELLLTYVAKALDADQPVEGGRVFDT